MNDEQMTVTQMCCSRQKIQEGIETQYTRMAQRNRQAVAVDRKSKKELKPAPTIVAKKMMIGCSRQKIQEGIETADVVDHHDGIVCCSRQKIQEGIETLRPLRSQ